MTGREPGWELVAAIVFAFLLYYWGVITDGEK